MFVGLGARCFSPLRGILRSPSEIVFSFFKKDHVFFFFGPASAFCGKEGWNAWTQNHCGQNSFVEPFDLVSTEIGLVHT